MYYCITNYNRLQEEGEHKNKSSQRITKMRPFWSPWRVEKIIGDLNCQKGRPSSLPLDFLSSNPDLLKTYDHKIVQCLLLHSFRPFKDLKLTNVPKLITRAVALLIQRKKGNLDQKATILTHHLLGRHC